MDVANVANRTSDGTDGCKLKFVEQALHAGWIKTPKNEVIRTENWAQLISPSVKALLRNGVFRSILDEEEVQAKIDSVIDVYQSHAVPFWWVVSPSTKPSDMGQRLLANGFKLAYTAIAMVAAPERVHIKRQDGVEVELVNQSNLDEWIAVQAIGWSTPPGVIDTARSNAQKWLAESANLTRADYLARCDGVPAGVGCVQFFDDFAHLSGGVVLPAFRRRGIFSTMVAARLELVKARNLPLITVHCIRETSAPIFQHFGFETVCEFDYYEYTEKLAPI